MRISLIICTYNKPDYLNLVLASVARQVEKPWEVIVADDGSSADTTRLISYWMNRSTFKLIHMFQPDDGFRLSRSRNLSSTKASGDLLIFIDGDCLLPKDFLVELNSLYRPGYLIFGSRKLISETETDSALSVHVGYDGIQRFYSGRKFLKLGIGPFRRWPRRSWKNVRGFMMALGRHDVMAMGGFDESFNSWGLEDSDFALRASRLGLKFLDSRYRTSVVHLYHPEPDSAQKSKNAGAFRSLLGDTTRLLPIKTSLLECIKE